MSLEVFLPFLWLWPYLVLSFGMHSSCLGILAICFSVLPKLIVLPACEMNGFIKRRSSSVQGLTHQGVSVVCVAYTVLCSGCTILQASCMDNVWSLARMCWVLSRWSALICFLTETWNDCHSKWSSAELSGQERWCGHGLPMVFWGRGHLHWDLGKPDWPRSPVSPEHRNVGLV